jgi:hypothetical protein
MEERGPSTFYGESKATVRIEARRKEKNKIWDFMGNTLFLRDSLCSYYSK